MIAPERRKAVAVVLALALVVVVMAGGTIIHADATNGDDEGSLYLPIVGRNWKGTNGAPTPSPTEPPAPTETPGTVVVLDNHRAYVDRIGYLHVVGEVKNNTGQSVDFVRVTVNLFNQQNQVIDTDFGYSRIDILSPGERTCFEVLFLGSPDYAYYTFETEYDNTEDETIPISVFGDSGAYNPLFPDWYEIVGQARNDGSVNAEYVQIVGTLYQTNGKVLGCDFTYTNADVLTPGQVSTWKMLFLYAPNGSVQDYRLQAQAREQ